MVFIDLKKVYDKVCRKNLKWTLMMKSSTKVYMNMWLSLRINKEFTRVKRLWEETENFTIKVEMHRSLGFESLLVIINIG